MADAMNRSGADGGLRSGSCEQPRVCCGGWSRTPTAESLRLTGVWRKKLELVAELRSIAESTAVLLCGWLEI